MAVGKDAGIRAIRLLVVVEGDELVAVVLFLRQFLALGGKDVKGRPLSRDLVCVAGSMTSVSISS